MSTDKEASTCFTSDNFCQAGESFCQKDSTNDAWMKPSFIDPTMVDFETQMKNSMMGKVMESFEKTMNEQTRKFDEIRRMADLEERKRDKNQNTQHIPSNIKNEGVSLNTLWKKVHNMLLNTDEPSISGRDLRKITINSLDPELYQIITSHGIAAWMSTLDPDHYQYLVNKIYVETSSWIAKIWRFKSNSCLFHNQLYDGMLKVSRAALCDRYPKYLTDGYNALYSRPPVFYLNCSVDPYLISYLKINLGLPSLCIALVPNNFETRGDEAMDLIALEKLVTNDVVSGRMPLLIQAFAGTQNTGSMDFLNDINTICRTYKIWLHIEGLKLAHLALLQVPAQINNLSSKVKSLTLDIGNWIGIPSIPFVTMIHTDLKDSCLKRLGMGAGYGVHNNTGLNIFPIWLGLQIMGYDGIVRKLEHRMKLSAYTYKTIKKIHCVRMVNHNKKKPAESESTVKETSIKNLMDSVLTFLLEGHQIPLVVLFKFEVDLQKIELKPIKDEKTDSVVTKKPIFVDETDLEESRLYLDSLNQWLGDTLKVSFPEIGVKIVRLPSEGVCLRICVQDNINSDNMTCTNIDNFVAGLETHLSIMEATVAQRAHFLDQISSYEQLIYNDLPSWAGLGSVVFLPESCRETILALFPGRRIDVQNLDFLEVLSECQTSLNEINRGLVEQLRDEDEAFSLGRYDIAIRMETAAAADPTPVSTRDARQLEDEDEPGPLVSEETLSLYCVRFGLVTSTTVIDNLIRLVVDKGAQVEGCVKDFDKFTELVKVGINEVTKQLEVEQEEKIRNEGILRQLPYIDSLMNWFSPVGKKSVVGRSLNLPSGEIQMTENTYKFKMQLRTGSSSIFSIGDQKTDDLAAGSIASGTNGSESTVVVVNHKRSSQDSTVEPSSDTGKENQPLVAST